MGKRKLFLILGICLVFVLAVLPFLTACNKTTTTTTTTKSTTTTTTATSTAQPHQKLKIGCVTFLGFYIGLDMYHGVQAAADIINKKGGLNIGGTIYDVEIIFYDSNNDQATSVAAINKLVFEDKVKYIVSDGWVSVDATIAITEANKVILCSGSVTPGILMPENHYSFMPVFINTGSTGMEGWLADTYPDKKTIVLAVPDNPMGQMSAGKAVGQFSTFGITPTIETYPATATDLSALGTKIKMLNPDILFATVGSGQAYAAAYNAGWRGLMFSGTATTAQEYLTQMTPEMLEGLIGGALPTEWDPPRTAYAKEFKDAWIARFGKWDVKDYNSVGCFDCLIAGIVKANSLNTDDVANAIGSGLEYETAQGPGRMISRPDLGNNRTVDSVLAWIMKEVRNGKAEYVTTISIEDSLAYFREYIDFLAQHPEMAGGPH